MHLIDPWHVIIVMLLVASILVRVIGRPPRRDFVPPTAPALRMAELLLGVLDLKPGDVVIVRSKERLSQADIASLKAHFEGVWPAHRCVVLPEGLEISIMREVKPHG